MVAWVQCQRAREHVTTRRVWEGSKQVARLREEARGTCFTADAIPAKSPAKTDQTHSKAYCEGLPRTQMNVLVFCRLKAHRLSHDEREQNRTAYTMMSVLHVEG